jgi:hypothetical protein
MAMKNLITRMENRRISLGILLLAPAIGLTACGPGFKAIPAGDPLWVRPAIIKPTTEPSKPAAAQASPQQTVLKKKSKSGTPPQKTSPLSAANKGEQSSHENSAESGETAASEMTSICPSSYVAPLKSFETKGLKGWWNGGLIVSALSHFTEGEALHPRKTCEDRKNPLTGLNLNLDETIKSTAQLLGLDEKVLTNLDTNCLSETTKASNAEDAGWIRSYAVISFAQRWKAFESELKDLIELREQFALSNPDPSLKPLDCEVFKAPNIKRYCKATPTCGTVEQRTKNFEGKAELISSIMNGTQSLRNQTQLNQEAKKALEKIESASLLSGKNLSKIRFSMPTVSEVKKALLLDLHHQQSILDERLTALNQALNCTLGLSDQHCGSVQKEFLSLHRDSRSQIPDLALDLNSPQPKAFNELRRFKQCYTETSENLKEVNGKMNTFVDLPLLLLGPGMALGTLKVFSRGAELGPKVIRSLRQLNLATGLTMSAMLERDIINNCYDLAEQSSLEAQKLRADMTARQSALSCKSSVEQYSIKETALACEIQMGVALIPAGLATREFLSMRGVLSQHLSKLPRPQ